MNPLVFTSPPHNPVWVSSDQLRDPSIFKTDQGYHLFYSRHVPHAPTLSEQWRVAAVFTKDFVHFEKDRDIAPVGHASPGDVVHWHGRYLLPYQSYPESPTQLVYSESDDLTHWSKPKPFLTATLSLPWNDGRRVIDPTFVVAGDTLHCFFVGTTYKPSKANRVGHAITRDPMLQEWEILSKEAPLIGRTERATDGAENVMVFRTGDQWTMIFSEGLADQHLALATSPDLRTWTIEGPLPIERQRWMAKKYGAPFVWKEGETWQMLLMGENGAGHTSFGLLSSPDGRSWTPLPEKSEPNPGD